MSAANILAEIKGREVFAWWPVKLRDFSGFYEAEWAWMRPVVKKHYIGFPAYFYVDPAEVKKYDPTPC
jgi:hypothetical protein